MDVFSNRKTEQLSLAVVPELREQLVALAYLRGHRGAYAAMVRDLLTRELRRYLAVELDPEERAEYNRILEAVKANHLVARMQRQDTRERREALAEHAAATESETELINEPISLLDDLDLDDDEGEGK